MRECHAFSQTLETEPMVDWPRLCRWRRDNVPQTRCRQHATCLPILDTDQQSGIGEVGLSYVCYQLSRCVGWNQPTAYAPVLLGGFGRVKSTQTHAVTGGRCGGHFLRSARITNRTTSENPGDDTNQHVAPHRMISGIQGVFRLVRCLAS